MTPMVPESDYLHMKAEVERLTAELAETVEIRNAWRSAVEAWKDRANAAEAKVERLTAELADTRQDRIKLTHAEADAAQFRTEYEGAAVLVARMHAAATGNVGAPVDGVVEDVAAIRTRALEAEFEGATIQERLTAAEAREAALRAITGEMRAAMDFTDDDPVLAEWDRRAEQIR